MKMKSQAQIRSENKQGLEAHNSSYEVHLKCRKSYMCNYDHVRRLNDEIITYGSDSVLNKAQVKTHPKMSIHERRH